jgi:aminopeptidase N
MAFGVARQSLARGATSFGRRQRFPSIFVAAMPPQTVMPPQTQACLTAGTCPTSGAFAALATRGGSSTALNSAVAAEAEKTAPVENFRKDYAPLPYVVSKINMNFVIEDGKTTVTSEMTITPNEAALNFQQQDMVLDGDESAVKLMSLVLNGRNLEEGTDYTLEPGKIILKASAIAGAASNTLETVVEIVPEDNTQLSGLYKSGAMYCTQCEAMGFRRITYYPDRPDNMAIFEKIRIEASEKDYPILLSNGNLIDKGELGSGRHYATWKDPFPKPSYLFCAVAGNLGSIQDSYTTTSGRNVKLEIFSEKENVSKLQYAMESLKRSMKWDEDKFGLEYDLDLYNIVAVNDFNMGAMENKGLNVFNTAYVLADPATASDVDYERVEGVIGYDCLCAQYKSVFHVYSTYSCACILPQTRIFP